MMSVAMPTDITVVMRDEPGEIARLGELIGADGVHVRGLAAFTGDGHGFVHLLLDDADVPKAKAALSRETVTSFVTTSRSFSFLVVFASRSAPPWFFVVA